MLKEQHKEWQCKAVMCRFRTRLFNEGVPDAGATTILVGHPFDLIRGCRCSEHEALGEALPAQPARVQPYSLREH